MRYVAALLVVFAFILTLVGSAYAHKSEIVGDYKIEVGWKNEPPVVGQKNAIEIIVTVATEHDKESHEESGSETHDEEHMEHEESGSETHDEEHMEHEELEPGTGVTGLSDKLEATVSLQGKKTTLILIETSKAGVYHADYTPAEVGFPLVTLVGEIGHQEFEITFHPEKVEPISALSPLSQIRSGIKPAEVLCKEDLELFMRTDGSVVCIKSTTAQVLVSRGWELTQLEMMEHETAYGTQEGM